MFANDKGKQKQQRAGQSLIEVLVALAIGVILIGAAAFAIATTLRLSGDREKSQIASGLAMELAEKVEAVTSADWLSIYNLPVKGLAGQYFVATSTGDLVITSGVEQVTFQNAVFTRFFTVDDVCRDSGAGSFLVDCGDAGALGDPSSQKISISVSWNVQGALKSSVLTRYLTRSQNAVFRQSDWSGSYGVLGPIEEPTDVYATSSNIDTASGSIRIRGF